MSTHAHETPDEDGQVTETETGEHQDFIFVNGYSIPMGPSGLPDFSRFKEGEDRYSKFCRQIFDVQPTEVQQRLLRAVATNQRVVAVGANGPGKSFIAAMLNGAFLFTNPNSICMPTSGTYSVLTDTLWRPLQSRVKRISDQVDNPMILPGRCLQSPPRIDIRDEWYLKAVSPTHPSNLEGRHAGTMMITIEEADKPDISMAHIDSAESMMTSDEDRMLVIANPPEDEGNLVYELMEDDSWATVTFSSFESRNVRIDTGELDEELGIPEDADEETRQEERDAAKVPGLVDLQTIKHDWKRWNSEPWPGVEEARTAHERRDDLDTRWYRRRAGVMPPMGAEAHRPIYVSDVRGAVDRTLESGAVESVSRPLAVAVDVARKGGDETVLAVLYPNRIDFTSWQGMDHTINESRIMRLLDQVEGRPPLAIDAVGEGSALADRINTAYEESIRFKAGQKAVQKSEYYNRWTEGLVALGEVLVESDVVIRDEDFREELFATARTVELEENHRRSGDVLRATSKQVVKDRLGRSPDRLDAAMMAAWAKHIQEVGPTVEKPRVTRSY